MVGRAVQHDARRCREPFFALKVGPLSWFCHWSQDAARTEQRQTSDADGQEESWLLVEACPTELRVHERLQAGSTVSLFIACTIGLLVLITIVIFICKAHFRPHHAGQVAGGLAAVWAVLRSCVQVFRHQTLNKSGLRRCTLRILWVVPLFALDSWICLIVEEDVHRLVMLLTCAREVYEAFAVCAFMQLVLTFLGGPVRLSNRLQEDGQRDVEQLGPLRFVLPPYKSGPSFVSKMVMGILQYAVVAPCLFVLTFIIWGSLLDPDLLRFQQGLLRLKSVPPIVKALSCGIAMYHLALLYREVHLYLVEFRPVLKFLGIKAIVFFTFWQGILIDCLASTSFFSAIFTDASHLNDDPGWTPDQMIEGLKNFLLCLEMPIFSEIHAAAYPYDEWENFQSTSNCGWNADFDARPDAVSRITSAEDLTASIEGGKAGKGRT